MLGGDIGNSTGTGTGTGAVCVQKCVAQLGSTAGPVVLVHHHIISVYPHCKLSGARALLRRTPLPPHRFYDQSL